MLVKYKFTAQNCDGGNYQEWQNGGSALVLESVTADFAGSDVVQV